MRKALAHHPRNNGKYKQLQMQLLSSGTVAPPAPARLGFIICAHYSQPVDLAKSNYLCELHWQLAREAGQGLTASAVLSRGAPVAQEGPRARASRWGAAQRNTCGESTKRIESRSPRSTKVPWCAQAENLAFTGTPVMESGAFLCHCFRRPGPLGRSRPPF